MLFNSIQFLLFFPIVTILYFLLPHKFRWLHLLVASCVFYMVFVPVYILILVLTIVIDYIAGRLIENAAGTRRRWFLVMSIAANVGVLAFFKYYNFFAHNVDQLLHIAKTDASLPILDIILPIGLSFHTFQAMSYTIEVYRGNQKAERHFGIYALYVMFYPQLVAGPIERPQNLLHQFYEKHRFDFENFVEGLKLMLWGFFKKVVIADRLSMVVNNVYKHPTEFKGSGVAITVATVFFAFQIYCDFSGYSDIAIGAAKVMGFRLMRNFNRPYFAKSISEFWTRWHISLSTWFKDYLYIPLGGNRVSPARHLLNLAIVFLLSGLWHGANWTFIVWGALHAFYLIFGLLTRKRRLQALNSAGISETSALSNFLSVVTTFVLATFAWIFFRANNLRDAWFVISHLGHGWSQLTSFTGIKSIFTSLGAGDTVYGAYNVITGILLIALLELLQARGNSDLTALLKKKKALWSWGFYVLMIVLVLLLGVYNQQEFIYFQF